MVVLAFGLLLPLSCQKQGEALLNQVISFDKTTLNVTVGEPYSEPKLSGAKTEVTYSSSNESVATVNTSSGVLTLVGEGTTSIVAVAEQTDKYLSATAKYTLTVKGKPTQLTNLAFSLVKNENRLTDNSSILIGSTENGVAVTGCVNSTLTTSAITLDEGSVKEPGDYLRFTLHKNDKSWELISQKGRLGATSLGKVNVEARGTTTWNIIIRENGYATISSTEDGYGILMYSKNDGCITTSASRNENFVPVQIFLGHEPWTTIIEGNEAAGSSSITKITVNPNRTTAIECSYTSYTSEPVSCGIEVRKKGETLYEKVLSSSIDKSKSSFTANIPTYLLEYENSYEVRSFVELTGDGDYRYDKEIFYSELKEFTIGKRPEGDPEVINTNGWLKNLEIPYVKVKLEDYAETTKTVKETYGKTNAYIYEPVASDQLVVTHTFAYQNNTLRNFTILYDYDKLCALWVAYPISKELRRNVGRNDAWAFDPAVPEDKQPNLTGSYKGNYDRGHQMASNDSQCTVEANNQTFYYTNMTPQLDRLNQGIWATLELDIQNYAAKCENGDCVYVVTGPIFGPTYSFTTDYIGVKCPLCSQYYKCVVRTYVDSKGTVTNAIGAAYLFDHSSSSRRISTTIDEVEKLTGFDFFCNLPDNLEEKVEATSELKL